MKSKKIPPSLFLRSISADGIYDADELGMDYAAETGLKPCWPIHSAKRAQVDVMLTGRKGCWMNTSKPMSRVAYGYEIAEAVSKELLREVESFPKDAALEDRFMVSLLALEESDK